MLEDTIWDDWETLWEKATELGLPAMIVCKNDSSLCQEELEHLLYDSNERCSARTLDNEPARYFDVKVKGVRGEEVSTSNSSVAKFEFLDVSLTVEARMMQIESERDSHRLMWVMLRNNHSSLQEDGMDGGMQGPRLSIEVKESSELQQWLAKVLTLPQFDWLGPQVSHAGEDPASTRFFVYLDNIKVEKQYLFPFFGDVGDPQIQENSWWTKSGPTTLLKLIQWSQWIEVFPLHKRPVPLGTNRYEVLDALLGRSASNLLYRLVEFGEGIRWLRQKEKDRNRERYRRNIMALKTQPMQAFLERQVVVRNRMLKRNRIRRTLMKEQGGNRAHPEGLGEGAIRERSGAMGRTGRGPTSRLQFSTPGPKLHLYTSAVPISALPPPVLRSEGGEKKKHHKPAKEEEDPTSAVDSKMSYEEILRRQKLPRASSAWSPAMAPPPDATSTSTQEEGEAKEEVVDSSSQHSSGEGSQRTFDSSSSPSYHVMFENDRPEVSKPTLRNGALQWWYSVNEEMLGSASSPQTSSSENERSWKSGCTSICRIALAQESFTYALFLDEVREKNRSTSAHIRFAAPNSAPTYPLRKPEELQAPLNRSRRAGMQEAQNIEEEVEGWSDDQYVVGSRDGLVTLLEGASGQPLIRYPIHRGCITTLRYERKLGGVLTGSTDHTASVLQFLPLGPQGAPLHSLSDQMSESSDLELLHPHASGRRGRYLDSAGSEILRSKPLLYRFQFGAPVEAVERLENSFFVAGHSPHISVYQPSSTTAHSNHASSGSSPTRRSRGAGGVSDCIRKGTCTNHRYTRRYSAASSFMASLDPSTLPLRCTRAFRQYETPPCDELGEVESSGLLPTARIPLTHPSSMFVSTRLYERKPTTCTTVMELLHHQPLLVSGDDAGQLFLIAPECLTALPFYPSDPIQIPTILSLAVVDPCCFLIGSQHLLALYDVRAPQGMIYKTMLAERTPSLRFTPPQEANSSSLHSVSECLTDKSSLLSHAAQYPSATPPLNLSPNPSFGPVHGPSTAARCHEPFKRPKHPQQYTYPPLHYHHYYSSAPKPVVTDLSCVPLLPQYGPLPPSPRPSRDDYFPLSPLWYARAVPQGEWPCSREEANPSPHQQEGLSFPPQEPLSHGFFLSEYVHHYISHSYKSRLLLSDAFSGAGKREERNEDEEKEGGDRWAGSTPMLQPTPFRTFSLGTSERRKSPKERRVNPTQTSSGSPPEPTLPRSHSAPPCVCGPNLPMRSRDLTHFLDHLDQSQTQASPFAYHGLPPDGLPPAARLIDRILQRPPLKRICPDSVSALSVSGHLLAASIGIHLCWFDLRCISSYSYAVGQVKEAFGTPLRHGGIVADLENRQVVTASPDGIVQAWEIW